MDTKGFSDLCEDLRPKLCLLGKEALMGKEHPIFKYTHHAPKAFETLNQMRKSGTLCDVTLRCGVLELPSHKNVLSACSPYFFAMFTGEMAEAKSDTITLQEMDPKALSLLIDYMYTSEIRVNEENVQTLLPAAKFLQIGDVHEACCEFLQSQLHPSNCIGICDFADLHACNDLHHYALTYIEQHFVEVVHFDEFLALGAERVARLISSDKLTVSAEEQVYEAVISWINHDMSSRQQSIDTLLENVRLPLMAQDYIVQQVEEEPLVKNSSRCKDFLIEAMKYHLLKTEQKALYKSPRTIARNPIGLPKWLLVVGGQAPKAIRSVECYDFQGKQWTQLAEMPSRRCRCGLAVLNGLVYAVGGFNGSLRVRSVDVYDPISDTWNACNSMEARRSTLGVAVLNGLIYAVGGFDGSTGSWAVEASGRGLETAECFDPRTGEWKNIASMSVRRSSVGVGVVGGLLYAVGGYDGASRQCLASVEAYNPICDAWIPVPDMSCRRSGAGVGVVDNLLYAVGGHDGPLVRRSVEVFHPDRNIWMQVPEMFTCRRNAGVVATGGCLYVVGGDDGSANLGSVEMFDPMNNQWTVLDYHMMTKRSYAGVAVIEKPTL